jgi:hypothetical protein
MLAQETMGIDVFAAAPAVTAGVGRLTGAVVESR